MPGTQSTKRLTATQKIAKKAKKSRTPPRKVALDAQMKKYGI